MSDSGKTPKASQVMMTESMLPGDGNPLGTASSDAGERHRIRLEHARSRRELPAEQKAT